MLPNTLNFWFCFLLSNGLADGGGAWPFFEAEGAFTLLPNKGRFFLPLGIVAVEVWEIWANLSTQPDFITGKYFCLLYISAATLIWHFPSWIVHRDRGQASGFGAYVPLKLLESQKIIIQLQVFIVLSLCKQESILTTTKKTGSHKVCKN